MSSLNWVDALVIILLVRMSYIGFARGIWVEAVKFAGWLMAVVAGATYYEVVGDWCLRHVSVGPTFAEVSAFALIIAAVLLATHGLIRILSHSKRVTEVSSLLKGAGAVVGLVRGGAIAGLWLLALSGLPNDYLHRSIRERSVLSPTLTQNATQIYETLMRWSPGPGSATGRLFPF